jgi:hypothetical protein
LFPVTSGCIGQEYNCDVFSVASGFTDSSCLFFDYSLLLQLPSALLKELFFSFLLDFHFLLDFKLLLDFNSGFST